MAPEGGQVAIDERPMSLVTTDLAGKTNAATVLDEDLDHIEASTDVIQVVFAPVRFPDQRCGESARRLVIIWIGSCLQSSPTIAEFGDGTTTTIIHEIMHALGAVETCAPHHGRDGHVVDDRTDLMYVGSDAAPASERVLDPGRDDYFLHGNDGCWDVARHPAWRR
ncbi:MAG: hypothetical protein ACRDZ3_18175 [Acidimicrobiia bacterium]